jgi:hypothetical protein
MTVTDYKTEENWQGALSICRSRNFVENPRLTEISPDSFTATMLASRTSKYNCKLGTFTSILWCDTHITGDQKEDVTKTRDVTETRYVIDLQIARQRALIVGSTFSENFTRSASSHAIGSKSPSTIVTGPKQYRAMYMLLAGHASRETVKRPMTNDRCDGLFACCCSTQTTEIMQHDTN